jgi:hypothetical protein
VTIYLLKPVCDVVECGLLGYVIHEYDSHRTFVVSLGDCAKSFLSSRIPHLKFDSLVEHVNRLDFEVDACRVKRLKALTNRRHMAGGKLVL